MGELSLSPDANIGQINEGMESVEKTDQQIISEIKSISEKIKNALENHQGLAELERLYGEGVRINRESRQSGYTEREMEASGLMELLDRLKEKLDHPLN